jgi:predicted Zn-dependent protease with MMP-like domain
MSRAASAERATMNDAQPTPGKAQHHIDAAWTAYRQAKPLPGIDHARRAIEVDHEDGEAWHALACNLERAGRLRESDKAFAKAQRSPNRAVGAPWRVTWARFQRSVKSAALALPAELRGALDEVTLVMADYAEPYLIEDYADPELLGLFEGAERAERGGAFGLVSPRIHIWRRSHEHASGSAKEFDAEIRQTLHHELGHYLGYDEDRLGELGMD